MLKKALPFILSVLFFSFFSSALLAQDIKEEKDTFFLAKRGGLLGKLAKSISTDGPGPDGDAVKVVNPFIAHTGKIIRTIEFLRLGFERTIFDTTIIRNNFGAILANGFHKKTTVKTIKNNLFFMEGDRVHPYLLADNERHLRDQIYIQDARILIDTIAGTRDSVDVIVITKDIFPLGGSIDMSSLTKMAVQVKNENIGGSGSRLSLSSFYDIDRNPVFAYDAGFLKRNIMGSFIDWSVGFKNYRNAFNSGRAEETMLNTHLEKPLVTPYIPWIGAADISFARTSNNYLPDSLYKSDFKYSYRSSDLWFGYNFGSQRLLYKNMNTRVRKFIAIRNFYQHFTDIPGINHQLYDYRYANIRSTLGALSVFRQESYRANFIYGFGRNEDVPEGFSASLIGGITTKQDRNRPYFGLETLMSHFSKKGFYSTYTLRMGGYTYQKRWEDIDMLFNVDHFTKLKRLKGKWLNRNFFGAGFTKQIRPVLDQPLTINSIFGLPYFRGNPAPSDMRTTVKTEIVFFNMQKFWGFRLAPFFFADMSLLTPTNQSFTKSDLYSAIGGGVRTRNENLTFGTVELRGYYFPRTVPGMKNYKIELGTNIRFRYNSVFIRKPDFVLPN
ncbi:hypothetical protein BH11BAC5_BH11BAC5_45490 [soil metagenome]